MELALATKIRVSTPFVRLSLPEVRLGIVPGAGGIRRLRKLIGQSAASMLVLQGEPMDGVQAKAAGLVDSLTKPPSELVSLSKDQPGPNNHIGNTKIDGLIWTEGLAKVKHGVSSHALTVAQRICQGSPVAVGAAVRLLQAEDEGGVLESHEYERCLTAGRRDRDEALQAFVEKRKPVFQGA